MNARFKKALAIARASQRRQQPAIKRALSGASKRRLRARACDARTSRTKDEWLTPRAIVEALGPFTLDPCAPIVRPWDTAAFHFHVHDNGLAQNWRGRVWMNPPYGLECAQWMQKFIAHGNGIALVAARTSSRWFQAAWEACDAALFVAGKITYHNVDGSKAAQQAPFPNVFFAIGAANVAALRRALERGVIKGRLVLNERKAAA